MINQLREKLNDSEEAQRAQADADAIATAGDGTQSVRTRPILKGWVGRALAAAARARDAEEIETSEPSGCTGTK